MKRNGRGPTYWTACEVVTCEPDREFAFDVGVSGKPVNTWRYLLEPSGDGTDVTESFELADTFVLRLYWRLAGWARAKTNQRGMQATLERMKAELEAGLTIRVGGRGAGVHRSRGAPRRASRTMQCSSWAHPGAVSAAPTASCLH